MIVNHTGVYNIISRAIRKEEILKRGLKSNLLRAITAGGIFCDNAYFTLL